MERRKLAGRASLCGCSTCPAEAKLRRPSGIRGWCCAGLDVEEDMELRFVRIRDTGSSDVRVRVDENEGKRAHDTRLANSLLYRSCIILYHLSMMKPSTPGLHRAKFTSEGSIASIANR